MSFAARYNTPSVKFDFKIPETHNFAKPLDLVNAHGIEKVYTVRSIYINGKGKYGDEPVIVCDECLVNAPKHVVDVCKQILQDDEAILDINHGKVGFKFYEYENEHGRQFSLIWVDLNG